MYMLRTESGSSGDATVHGPLLQRFLHRSIHPEGDADDGRPSVGYMGSTPEHVLASAFMYITSRHLGRHSKPAPRVRLWLRLHRYRHLPRCTLSLVATLLLHQGRQAGRHVMDGGRGSWPCAYSQYPVVSWLGMATCSRSVCVCVCVCGYSRLAACRTICLPPTSYYLLY